MLRAANQYSTSLLLDSAGHGIDLGFDAAVLRIVNRGVVPIHFSLKSTAASTDDPELRAGEILFMQVPLTSIVGLDTTSTATSTVGEDRLVEVDAWGG